MKRIFEFDQFRHRVLWMLYLCNLVTFVAGLFLPLLTVSKLILIQNTFSVVSGVLQLYVSGQYFLFVVITLFSVFFPCIKMVFLGMWLVNPNQPGGLKMLRLSHALGKWSMLDVFVVAVLVVAVKLAGLASVQMREGLYCFTASVLLTMIMTQLLSPFYSSQSVSHRQDH